MRSRGRGERVLASAAVRAGGTVAGTRDALLISSVEPHTPSVEPQASSVEPHTSSVEPVETTRIPWEQVEAADWDSETETLRVSEVGRFGEQRVEHALVLDDPDRLLQLVRERVTASVVLQRHVPVAGVGNGRRGLKVVARRAPRGDAPIAWFYEYDEGVDPADPAVREAAERALAAAREEVGDGPGTTPPSR